MKISEYKRKDSIVDHEDEDAVSFDMINTYFFRKDLSSGSGDEIVILPHLFLMVSHLLLQVFV